MQGVSNYQNIHIYD